MAKHETEPVNAFLVLIGSIVFSKDAVIFHSSTLDRPKIIKDSVSDCSTSLKSRKSAETGFFLQQRMRYSC